MKIDLRSYGSASRAMLLTLLILAMPLAGRAQAPVAIGLAQAAERVIEANPLVLAAHQDVLASEKQLSRAWREYVPTITANARYSYLDDDIALTVNPIKVPLPPAGITINVPPVTLLDRSTLRADVTATVPLFTGFRIASGIRASRHMVQDATAQDTLAMQRAVASTLVAYHQCLLADRLVAAREEAYATVTAHQHRVEALQQQGIATQYDRIRADLALSEAKKSLEESRNGRLVAYSLLKKQLAYPDSVRITLTDSLTYVPYPVDLESAIVEARGARPEIRSVEEKREAVHAMSNAEFGKMLPQIGAFARYEFIEKSLTQLDPRWIVGVSASLTIFNGFKDLAASQAYDIQEEKLNNVGDEVGNSIALEVRKYHADKNTAEQQIAAAETSLRLALEALRMADLRFSTGSGTSLEVLDAQTAVVAGKTSLALALYNYRTATIELTRSVARTDALFRGVF
ncbi:MAG: TolC family protein [Ignavibacteriae bacterium]|nr:TolC family protein [Ignavibacteriota bacterium]